jgi:hypothetical protein
MARTTRGRYDDPRTAAARRRPNDRGPGSGGIVTPVRVALIVAVVGSLAFVAYAMLLVRDESAIPMLTAGAVVLGIAFLALAVAGGRATLEAGRDGQGGRAFALAIAGGIAAMIGFGCFAGAVILVLVTRPA